MRISIPILSLFSVPLPSLQAFQSSPSRRINTTPLQSSVASSSWSTWGATSWRKDGWMKQLGSTPLDGIDESPSESDAAVIKETAGNRNDDDDDIENDGGAMEERNSKKKNYVVIGGGWGGWGAAKALCESSVDCTVTLIDSLPDPTGRTPYLSSTGKPVEAGTRGFWKDYPNLYDLVDELGLKEDDIFTPYLNSSFYSPDGLEATAPVFSEAAPSFLPSPLGQVYATLPLFERVPLVDRASLFGLLVATVDCLGDGGDTATMAKYDRMTAHDLFIRFKLTKRVVDDLIRPTLLVGLFKPPEELSALVVMELFYYYALAHLDSFDVRWIKNGTVSDSLVAPLAERLIKEERLNVMGGCRVGEVKIEEDADSAKDISTGTLQTLAATSVSYVDSRTGTGGGTLENVDGVVLALGCRGMKAVVNASPGLARIPEFSAAASLSGIDVISVRIWLDKKVSTRTPANVFAKFDSLRGAGGTFFMLDQLQPNGAALWGEDEKGSDDEKSSLSRGSVVACDFYNAGGLISLADKDIISILMKELLPSAVPAFADTTVLDSWVGKYPGTVSWFSPGSFSSRPPLEGAGKRVLPNVKCAGDWVRMGSEEHGAKGLCQERAYVSGLKAANSLLRSTSDGGVVDAHKILEVREDEAQFKAAVKLNKKVMKFLPRFWIR